MNKNYFLLSRADVAWTKQQCHMVAYENVMCHTCVHVHVCAHMCAHVCVCMINEIASFSGILLSHYVHMTYILTHSLSFFSCGLCLCFYLRK